MNNLMWDRRVVRGNTYASIVASKVLQPLPPSGNKLPKLNQTEDNSEDDSSSVRKRRVSIQIVTDQNVQNLTDKPPFYQKDTQTEPLPATPIPRYRMREKTGLDRQTQILDSDLFNFNYEVEPLLSVLVGRTLEFSRLQVLQQTELQVMRQKQQELHQADKQQAEKVRAMQQKEKKLAQQNQSRKNQLRKRLERSVYIHKKLVSRVVAKQFMKPLWPTLRQDLREMNFFEPAIKFQMSALVLPALYQKTKVSLQEEGVVQSLLMALGAEQIQNVQSRHRKMIAQEDNRRAKIIAHREELAREKEQRKQMRRQDKHSEIFQVEEAERIRVAAETMKQGDEQPQEESKE